MLRIADVIFSPDVWEKKFLCDLPKCLGICCHYGDSGAPLGDGEKEILDEIWPAVKPFLRKKGIEVIEKTGTSMIDTDGDRVTPLINNEECAYTILKDNIFMCGIEKACNKGKVKFQKPISCHLFPLKIKQFSGFRAVNYQELPICKSALKYGSTKEIYVYEFLKVPLIRALGKDIYHELCIAARELRKK